MKKNINNFVIIIIITILILLSRFRYLLFHTIVELLSISLGFSMLLFAITKLKLEEISKFEILSFSYGIIAIIDLFHTLAYKGMGVFHNISANEPTQLWISARILESITLFLYAVSFGINNYYKEKISKNIKSLFSLFLIILLIYLFFTFISIFILKIFPVCFIEERGLTAFKKITEYIIVFILFISLLMSSNSKDNFFRYYRLAIIFSIFSELSFTVYKDVYDLFNMTGHIFKYLSFIFVYRYTMANIIELPYLKLKELNALLESENQELILARKKAEEANRAKSAFIANINHEINTPLNAILIYANILYNQESNPDNRELINHIIDGGSNLYKIFENLILISQIEIDEFKIEYNESNLKDFIYTIISTYKYIEDKKELKLIVNLDESLNINIRIPQKLLWTIISNLLDNAIRFTDKGYISLCSKLEQDLLYINVKDTGSGFDINLCQSLLEPFNIGENYINKSKCGIGLGLSVVNKLVKLLNGEIKVESKINEGTEFIVVLDLKKEFS